MLECFSKTCTKFQVNTLRAKKIVDIYSKVGVSILINIKKSLATGISFCKNLLVNNVLHLPRLDLWHKMCSHLETVLCALEKCILLLLGGMFSKLQLSLRSNVSFKACVSLLTFCLDDLSIGISGVLKSPTIIVLLFISLLWLLAFALYIEVLLYWVHVYLQSLYLLLWLIPDHYVASFFVSCNSLHFKIYFVWYKYCYPSFLLISICMEYLFPSPRFQSVCVPRSEVGLL